MHSILTYSSATMHRYSMHRVFVLMWIIIIVHNDNSSILCKYNMFNWHCIGLLRSKVMVLQLIHMIRVIHLILLVDVSMQRYDSLMIYMQ